MIPISRKITVLASLAIISTGMILCGFIAYASAKKSPLEKAVRIIRLPQASFLSTMTLPCKIRPIKPVEEPA